MFLNNTHNSRAIFRLKCPFTLKFNILIYAEPSKMALLLVELGQWYYRTIISDKSALLKTIDIEQ